MEKNIYMTDFASRLSQLRSQTGQSARDMSLSLGQSHSYINRLESAKNYPTMQMFFYICDYFKITPSEFFDYKNEEPETQRKLVELISSLDAKLQKQFINLITDFKKN